MGIWRGKGEGLRKVTGVYRRCTIFIIVQSFVLRKVGVNGLVRVMGPG